MRVSVRYACVVVFLSVSLAHAYVGPGVGITMVGWFIGVVFALVAGAGAVIIWPIRRFLSSLRSKRRNAGGEPEA